MNLIARLAALEQRQPPDDSGDSGASERLAAKLDALAERRRQAGIPDRTPTSEEIAAIKERLRELLRERSA